MHVLPNGKHSLHSGEDHQLIHTSNNADLCSKYVMMSLYVSAFETISAIMNNVFSFKANI